MLRLICRNPGSPPATSSSNIQFGDLPSPRDGAEDNGHIAFVDGPRAPQREKALRIPGPREFERGIAFGRIMSPCGLLTL
jgi:hypothetical protein